MLAAALLCLLAALAGCTADPPPRATSDDRARPAPAAPGVVPAGRDEPQELRVYVDASGTRVEVSVRTARTPWRDRLVVRVGGRTTTVRRDRGLVVRTRPRGVAACAPEVDAPADSLITRLAWPRECFPDTRPFEATVTADGLAATATGLSTEPPNLLVLLVDDMRADELRWMPNVQERLAAEGVTFRNGFAGFPLCCPARASMLTGRLTHNHGVWHHQPPWGFTSFRDEETVAVWLQRAGYTTTYLGKYLNGYGKQPARGRTTGTSTQYCPPGWDRWRASIDGGLPPGHPQQGSTYRYFDTTLNDDCAGHRNLDGYQSHAYGRLAAEELRGLAGRDRPFFSYVSFTGPHSGLPREPDDPQGVYTPARPRHLHGAFDEQITEAPGARWRDPEHDDTPARLRWRRELRGDAAEAVLEVTRQRAEALHAVDEAIGEILGSLEEAGELDETLVVFTSDNGYFLGEHGVPQGKDLPYEPSLRVPVVVRGPGVPHGEVRTEPFLSVDHAPTYADLADAPPGAPVDGVSLLDVARLGDPRADDGWSRVVLTESAPSDAARAAARRDPSLLRRVRGKVTGLRTSRWLYTEWLPDRVSRRGPLVELYDVTADPQQYDNLADDGRHEELLGRLHRILAEARACAGMECRRMRLPEDLSRGR